MMYDTENATATKAGHSTLRCLQLSRNSQAKQRLLCNALFKQWPVTWGFERGRVPGQSPGRIAKGEGSAMPGKLPGITREGPTQDALKGATGGISNHGSQTGLLMNLDYVDY